MTTFLSPDLTMVHVITPAYGLVADLNEQFELEGQDDDVLTIVTSILATVYDARDYTLWLVVTPEGYKLQMPGRLYVDDVLGDLAMAFEVNRELLLDQDED